MKKTQKKILGLFGLAAVIAITFFAAFLPGPETSAVSTLTDTINVHVRSEYPNVVIDDPVDDASFVNPDQTIVYTFDNVQTITATLEYTNADGVTTSYNVYNDTPGDPSGVGTFNLNLADYGYGDFVLTIVGEDATGVSDGAVVEFAFYPLTAEANQSSETGNVDVDLNYDENNSDIDTIVINVYDPDGNLIEGLSPVTVTPPTTGVELDFAKYGLPDGTYTIEATAYDVNGNALYKPYTVSVNYVAGGVTPAPTPTPTPTPVPVPDTGGLLQGANISKTDYIITGLIIFTIVAIAGVMFAAKNRQKKAGAKSRRRR